MDRHSNYRHYQIATAVQAWRARSLNVVLWVILVTLFPILPVLIFEWPASFEASSAMRTSALVLYLLLVAIAVCRFVEPQWRAWALCFVFFVLAGLQLYRAGMAGGGRTTLLTIPLYALLLIGFRSSWVALLLGVLMYGAFIGLSASGFLADHMEVRENPVEVGFWAVHGIILLAGVVPLLVLLGRFRALHVRALEEQRRLEEEITRASEEERRRLGSELHDGLCQQLTAALLQCVALENETAAEQRQAAPSARGLRSLLEGAIGAAYDVARGLCPLDIGADSLVPALEQLMKQTRAATGLECTFQEEGDTSVADQQTALHLYRIAQEAVANAVKHAHSHRIVVTLRGISGSLVLQVEDDGSGMNHTASSRGGMGMSLMAYRTDVLGGMIDVEPVLGGGTRVVCRVPRQSNDNRGAGNVDSHGNAHRVFSTWYKDDSHGW